LGCVYGDYAKWKDVNEDAYKAIYNADENVILERIKTGYV